MYSIRYNSCIQQQQLIFDNQQMIKTKRYVFWSTKFYNKPREILPSYRTSCDFRKPTKDDRSSLTSFCVPDVYSPGSNGKCSPPPPSSNLPLPPSEWLS